MRHINEDIAMVQEAFAKEGVFDGQHVVVPEDFFDRLMAKLNPPGRPSLMDMLDELDARNDRMDAFEAKLPSMTLEELCDIANGKTSTPEKNGERYIERSAAKKELRRRGHSAA